MRYFRPKRRKKKKRGSRRKSRSFRIPRSLSKHSVEIFLGLVVLLLASTVFLLFKGSATEEAYVGDHLEAPQYPDEIKEEPRKPDPQVAIVVPVVPPKPSPKKSASKPQIAIIIDDLGGDKRIFERLLAIESPLTFAILPHLKYSQHVAISAKKGDRVVMLHLPMEPKSKKFDPGKGALRVSQSRAEIIKIFKEDLSSVPGAVGVNNHMGSRFTEDETKSRIVIEEIKRNGLFFVDSRTTANTVAYGVALGMNMPTAMRDVFLDNERDKTKIMEAILALADKAIMKGSAIGIGHPYKETASALEEILPKVRSMGVDVAPITQFLVSGVE